MSRLNWHLVRPDTENCSESVIIVILQLWRTSTESGRMLFLGNRSINFYMAQRIVGTIHTCLPKKSHQSGDLYDYSYESSRHFCGYVTCYDVLSSASANIDVAALILIFVLVLVRENDVVRSWQTTRNGISIVVCVEYWDSLFTYWQNRFRKILMK